MNPVSTNQQANIVVDNAKLINELTSCSSPNTCDYAYMYVLNTQTVPSSED